MSNKWLGALLWVLLAGMVNAKDTTVVNAGVGGNSTRNLLKRVEKDVLAKKPDVVIMTPLRARKPSRLPANACTTGRPTAFSHRLA